MRLLIVEDNRELSRLLTDAIGSGGITADQADSAADAKAMLRLSRYVAVILDLGLPDADGLTVLADMRNRGDATPVLALTARAGVQDRVTGLEAGADDYLGKPFAVEELLARLRALLRRPGALLGRKLEIGNLVFDSATRETFISDEPIYVPTRELEILELLLRRESKVVPKQTIESQLFGLDEQLGSNAVEVYVHRLRQRMETLRATIVIHTVRGIGYMIAPRPV